MCDTFVALPPATADGSVIFGKNSDREPNEAQALEFHPAQDHPKGSTVTCTYLTLPQVDHTHAVLISRPFWMWGAEIGTNEHGVVIGNEAVFTRIHQEKGGRLTGMDLLRLALERSKTALTALETITELLAKYGQGGRCGYQDKSLTYHNSFIIADPQEAWVLETAGPVWAAKKVTTSYSISNGLTIGEEFDLHHPELIPTAKRMGWLKAGEAFHFARCYSDWFYTTFSACNTRREHSSRQLREKEGKLNVSDAFAILRDHGGEPYRPDGHFLMNRICAHAANPLSRHASQSTASLVAHLTPSKNTFWATGTSAPCTGIFKPFWIKGDTFPDLGPTPGEQFNPDSLWWQHEQLHRSVLRDFQNRLSLYCGERDQIEKEFINRSQSVKSTDLLSFSRSCLQTAQEETGEWINKVRGLPVQRSPKFIYRRYWEKQNRKAGIHI